jgi:hypothetical protein
MHFQLANGAHTGTDAGGRTWTIRPVITGWRLMFRDPGDRTPIQAGTFRALADAKAEAQR